MPWGAVIGAAVISAGASMSAAESAEDAAYAQTQAQTEAANKADSLGREQLQFAKDQYADGAPMRDAAEKRAQQISDAMLASQQQQDALAKDYADYNKTTFRPMEERMVREAQAYDTPQRRAEAAAAARSDVEQAFGSTQGAMSRAISRTGATVGTGRGMALMQDQAFAKAKGVAGATTQASRNVETQGYARMADAANLGRGLPSAQATAASTAVQAGSASLNASNSGLGASMSGLAPMQTAYNTAISANNSAGTLYGQAGASYAGMANAGSAALGQFGQVAGRAINSYMSTPSTSTSFQQANPSLYYSNGVPNMTSDQASMYYSDENVKADTGQPIDPDEALEQIVDTPVEKGWKYDPAKGGPDEGGRTHDGPMAQQVRRTMGEAVAPGGKVIDIASMNGRLMGGMQALAKRMAKLEEKVSA